MNNDDFNNQLSKYPQILGYLYKNGSSDPKQNQELMQKLLDFYQTEVSDSVPKFINYSEKMVYFYSSDNLKIHSVIFLSNKLWSIKIQKYQEKVSLFSALISFLISFFDKYDKKITIKYQEIVNDFQAESEKAKSLFSRIINIQSNLHITKFFNPNSKKLYSMLVNHISQTNSNYISCFQHIFEASVSSNQFIFSSEINFLIQNFKNSKPEEFNKKIGDISLKISHHFEINGNKNIKIILISLMRFLYDSVYPTTFLTYFNENPKNIIQKVSKKVLFKDLSTNIRLFPHSIRPSKPFSYILRDDQYYGNAIDHLEEMQFMTNPLDMLFCVQRSLIDIEKAAHFYSHRQLGAPLQFHESMSAFLAVAISSDIPEIINLHKFINSFFLNDCFFPELCKARVVLDSCISNLLELDKGNQIKRII